MTEKLSYRSAFEVPTMRQNNASALIVLLTSLFLFSAQTQAIDVDSAQPIEIESDSATIDDSQGFSTYRGNVIIKQGSTKLAADNITVFARDRSVTQIVANGSPATFNQQDTGSNDATTGQAAQITYKAEEAVLVFDGEAKLEQTSNSFSGDRIEYDIMRKAIRAKGDQNTGTRVKIQYFPSQTNTPTVDSENPSTATQPATNEENL
jgi:lipopolysaccharide export system protein LptA